MTPNEEEDCFGRYEIAALPRWAVWSLVSIILMSAAGIVSLLVMR